MSPVIDPLPSRFLKPPSAQVPLVLLPVRLETRIEKSVDGKVELWLRVYPDDLHVNSFQPALSAEEQTARTTFLALPADVVVRKPAFAALARKFGAERAAWITSADAPAATGKPVLQTAAFTNVLPERWIVLGYQGRGVGEVLAIGPPIAETLAMGPVIGADQKLISDDTKWVSDFGTAIKAGMAFRIALTSQLSFKRIVVLGLKTGLDPQESAARLAELFEAHHYTDGLDLLANNTPTNNTEAVSSGLATKDTDFAALFALEHLSPLCPTRPTADGDRLARALNIAPETFAHVNSANGSQDEQASVMNRVLWPATWGYYLGQMVPGTMTNAELLVPAAYEHFVQHVRARGHFPTLRIGNQPYGILPVCWSARWKPLEGRAIDAPLHALITQLRAMWQTYTGGVPRIPKALDPEAELVELLGMVPSTASMAARNVIGPEYTFMFWNFVKERPEAGVVVQSTGTGAAKQQRPGHGDGKYAPGAGHLHGVASRVVGCARRTRSFGRAACPQICGGPRGLGDLGEVPGRCLHCSRDADPDAIPAASPCGTSVVRRYRPRPVERHQPDTAEPAIGRGDGGL